MQSSSSTTHPALSNQAVELLREASGSRDARATLMLRVGERDVHIDLTEVLGPLAHVVAHLALGTEFAIVPEDKALTTTQAARLLSVSRPTLIAMLDEGRLPYFKVGAHRRIRAQDVLEFQRARHQEGRDALGELSSMEGLPEFFEGD